MPNLNSALRLAQFQKFSDFLKKKRELAKTYSEPMFNNRSHSDLSITEKLEKHLINILSSLKLQDIIND